MRKKLHIEFIVDSLVHLASKKSGSNLPELRAKEKLALAYAMAEETMEHIDSLPEPSKDHFYHDTVVTTAVLKGMLRGETPVHLIGDKFGTHLNKTNVDVPCSHLLPLENAYYIEFPESVEFKIDDHYHTCAMVHRGKISNPALGDSLIMFLLPDVSKEGRLLKASYFFMPMRKSYTIQNAIDGLEDYLGTEIAQGDKDAMAFTAKCMLYLKTGNPDLKNEIVKYPETKKPKKIKNHWRKNFPFDITRVGYDFHGKTYTVDSTEVSGHFRWQPCGPGKQSLKLIWISEHIRNYST